MWKTTEKYTWGSDILNIEELLKKQKEFYQSGATLPVKFRIKMLLKLYKCIQKYEKEINEAVKKDLGKCEFDGFMCETGLVLMELNYMIRHTFSYAKKHKVYTPIGQCIGSSYKKASPYGNVLIMSPWNYPFLLTMTPVSDAIAAGNTIIVKPSAYSPASSAVIKKIIEECFPPEYVAVVTGGREENKELLNQKFDMIFFTGSQAVGKEILHKAADTLTPVVLELGGKNPCIVDSSAKIKLAAKRIVFGKFLNCGQTCVAPDYVICHSNIKEEFISEVKKQIIKQFGDNILDNDEWGKIVNEKHFNRICNLIEENKVVCGGEKDINKLKIAPTVMSNVTWDDKVMQEEIFGPIMPILTYDTIEEVINTVNSHDKPLALYLFTKDNTTIQKITAKCSYGGGCINDVIIHLATSNMGFGGVGESGMGSYHGKTGFDTFTHYKSIVDKKTWLDLPMRYQPYSKLNTKLIRFFLK